MRRPPGALLSSADSGKTWRNEALPDSVGRVVGTAFHPEGEGMYVGFDEGVLYRASRTASWSPVNEGLNHGSVQTLVRAPGGRDLYLGLANEDGEDGIYVRQIEK